MTEDSRLKGSSEQSIEPYGRLIDLGQGVYCVDGEWQQSPLRRRMTLIRLRSGELAVHSPIRLKLADYEWLDRLGRVGYVLAPNRFHASEAHHYASRYRDATILATRGAAKSLGKRCRVDGLLPEAWPSRLGTELDCLEIEGTRWLSECVFFHGPSRTLIVTDLVFNLHDNVRGLEKAFLKWNRIHRRLGPSRLFELLFLRDRKTASASIERMLAWDIERLVMSHGRVQLSDAGAALRAVFKPLLEQ